VDYAVLTYRGIKKEGKVDPQLEMLESLQIARGDNSEMTGATRPVVALH